MKKIRLLVGILSSSLAIAQSQEDLAKMKRAAEEMVRNYTFEYKFGVSGPVVKGQPYSAVVITESTQQLADGNRIHRESSFNIYRDIEGRIRRDDASGKEYAISDPVANVTYMVSDTGKVARKVPLAQEVPATDKQLAEMKARVYAKQSARIELAGPSEGRVAKVEDLGTKVIEGVTARGTKYVTTIPAGSAGNDQPMQIVDERWYAPELQLQLLTQHSDPRTGTSSYRLTKLSRTAPVSSLFEVPSTYQVVEGK